MSRATSRRMDSPRVAWILTRPIRPHALESPRSGPPSFHPRMTDTPRHIAGLHRAAVRRRAGGPLRAAPGRRRAARGLLLHLQPAHLHPGRTAGGCAPTRPRMDCVVVKRGGGLETIEPRRLRKGDLVAMGEAEDGTEGIVVHAQGFLGGAHGANEFRFMSTEVSRERPVNYEELAARVGEEKRRGGYLVWVVGPALVHSRARAGLRVVHPERLRPGGARRQRRRGARHRGRDLRHHAGHEQHRPADRGRARAAHAGHQPGARGRLDRACGGDRAASRAASCTPW